MVQADLDTLHKLGTILVGHADAIDQMKVTGTVTMPASPVQTQCNQVDDAVHKAFGLISSNIREMSNATKNAAGTYEQADQEFAAQLRKYTNGS